MWILYIYRDRCHNFLLNLTLFQVSTRDFPTSRKVDLCVTFLSLETIPFLFPILRVHPETSTNLPYLSSLSLNKWFRIWGSRSLDVTSTFLRHGPVFLRYRKCTTFRANSCDSGVVDHTLFVYSSPLVSMQWRSYYLSGILRFHPSPRTPGTMKKTSTVTFPVATEGPFTVSHRSHTTQGWTCLSPKDKRRRKGT